MRDETYRVAPEYMAVQFAVLALSVTRLCVKNKPPLASINKSLLFACFGWSATLMDLLSPAPVHMLC